MNNFIEKFVFAWKSASRFINLVFLENSLSEQDELGKYFYLKLGAI